MPLIRVVCSWKRACLVLFRKRASLDPLFPLERIQTENGSATAKTIHVTVVCSTHKAILTKAAIASTEGTTYLDIVLAYDCQKFA